MILFISTNLFSQVWRDSLKVARDTYKLKNYEKAIRYYESAQKFAPKGVDFSDEIGQSAYKAKEYERAEKVFRQSSSLKKDKESKSKVFHNIGNSRMQQKDYKGAIKAYKKALKNNSTNNKTRYNLSEAIRRLKENENKKNNKPNNDKKRENNPNNNPPKDNEDNLKNKQPNQKNDDNKSQNKESKLSNNRIEKLLDKLMKDESQTKRKISGSKDKKSKVTSGKDW
jgi:tetratricopeptide (TPR) repeat protein